MYARYRRTVGRKKVAKAKKKAPKNLLHGAHCCPGQPPRLVWDHTLECIVCDACDRVWAPIVVRAADVERAALIRAITMAEGNKALAGRLLNLDRHAVRRMLESYEIHWGKQTIAHPFAEPGPTSKDMIHK